MQYSEMQFCVTMFGKVFDTCFITNTAAMKQPGYTLLRIILLVVILYTTSFGAFAGDKKKAARKAPPKRHQVAATVTPAIAPPVGSTTDQPQNAVTPNGPQLAPRLKRRHKVAIVPA